MACGTGYSALQLAVMGGREGQGGTGYITLQLAVRGGGGVMGRRARGTARCSWR